MVNAAAIVPAGAEGYANAGRLANGVEAPGEFAEAVGDYAAISGSVPARSASAATRSSRF